MIKLHKIIYLFLVLLLPAVFTACSESEDTYEEFPDWQKRNDAYFSAIYEQARNNTDGTWKLIKNFAIEDTIPTDYSDYVVVQVIKEGTGSGCPMYSDSVMVNYQGRLIPSTSYADGYVFDGSYTGDYNPATAKPATFYVGGTVSGFATALQHMHIGDRWRVYIPYQLGYGSSENGSIPAYSTLIYDLELVAYFRAGTTPVPWGAPMNKWIKE